MVVLAIDALLFKFALQELEDVFDQWIESQFVRKNERHSVSSFLHYLPRKAWNYFYKSYVIPSPRPWLPLLKSFHLSSPSIGSVLVLPC